MNNLKIKYALELYPYLDDYPTIEDIIYFINEQYKDKAFDVTFTSSYLLNSMENLKDPDSIEKRLNQGVKDGVFGKTDDNKFYLIHKD